MEAKSGSRKRSQKQKRVSEKNAYCVQDKRVEETRAELDFMKKDLGRRAHFQAIQKAVKGKGSKDLKKTQLFSEA